MSGHNKWSKIKHKKAATDTARGKLFSKISKTITNESKGCGGDKTHTGLKNAIKMAKDNNMNMKNIDKAIKKGVGGNVEILKKPTYEFFGPGGVVVLVETNTDNTNRTTQEIRHILTKGGYSLGTPGSTAWAFSTLNNEIKAKSKIKLSNVDKEKLNNIVKRLFEQEDVDEIHTNAN